MKEKKERSLGSLLLEFSFWFKQNLEMKGLQNKHFHPCIVNSIFTLNIPIIILQHLKSGLSVRDL